MPSEFDDLTFRPLARADLRVLHEWIQRPHVAEWWDNDYSQEEVERDYLPTIDGGSTTKAYIAYLSGKPIGFIQSYVVKDSGGGWWTSEQDPGALGIDQFLVDANRLNQGLGTTMIRSFVARLFSDPAVTRIQTDPDPENHRAIRCYEKAGFVQICPVMTPDGPALLMACDRSRSGQ
ncbi:MAG: GNAT family N-acetyltransferase [Steroidobacteraceae bacterium]